MRHEPSNGTVLRRLHARLARVNRMIAKGRALIARRFGDRRETADAKATGRVAKLFAIASLVIFSAARASAQTPDCVSFFTFSNAGVAGALPAPGNTPTIDNRQTACINWTMVYEAEGFTGLSLTFQSADGATAPGAMGTFSGTVLTGSNPATSTVNSLTTFNGYVGWFRVALSGLTGTGTVRGALYGYRNGYPPPSSGAPCPGTTVTPCVVAGENAGTPKIIQTDAAGNLITDTQVFNGTTWVPQLSCTNVAIVDDSTSGNIQQIVGIAFKQIRICKLSLTSASAVGIQLTYGVGANCGAAMNLSGLYQGVTAIAEDFQADQSPLVALVGNTVCLNLSGTIRTTGQIFYAQF